MNYRKIHVYTLLWLLQNYVLEFQLSYASPAVFHSNDFHQVKPANFYSRSLRSNYDPNTDPSNGKYESYNLMGDKIKRNTYNDNGPSSQKKFEEYGYGSKRHASIGDESNSTIKTRETESRSSDNSMEHNGEIIGKRRQIGSDDNKEVSSSSPESNVGSRTSRGILHGGDISLKGYQNNFESPRNDHYSIRSKRKIYRRRKHANQLSHFHKRNSPGPKRETSKYSKAIDVQKRVTDRSVQSTSPRTFMKEILDMMKSREIPATTISETHSGTTLSGIPAKFKKDISSKMNDDADDTLWKKPISNSKIEHTNDHDTNTLKRSPKNPIDKSPRSNPTSVKEKHQGFYQKRHNLLDKYIRRHSKPIQPQHLQKRQEQQLTTTLSSSSGGPTIATTALTAQQVTTASKNETSVSSTKAPDKVGGSSVAPEVNSTLKSLNEDQKSQLKKFASDLKTFVWNYIEGQSGLNETRKQFVFGIVLKSLPGLIVKHIKEVI